jgi:uncharacterized membrane protein
MSTQTGVLLAASVGLSLLLFLVAFLFLIIFRRQKKQYQTLKEEKLIAELKASKREREEIATELHNDIIPNILTVQMILNQPDIEQSQFVKDCVKKIGRAHV